MNKAMWIAMTGLEAQQTRMSVISNNLANVNTMGFKRDRAVFEEIAALSLSGLPTGTFAFEGFLPVRAAARRQALVGLATETRTLVFYEAPHRLSASLGDLAECFGHDRPAAVLREITKKFESAYRGTLAELAQRAATDVDMARGEIVIVVHGAVARPAGDEAEAERVLRELLAEMPASQAARLAARLTGRARKDLYERAIAITESRR